MPEPFGPGMQTTKRSAGVVVVRWEGTAPRYLLLRCYGYWDFPKGETEPGEPELETAVREVAEETGLRDLDFRWGTPFHETPVYGKGKIARYYLAEATAGEVVLPVSPELGRPEHHEFRWLSYPEASTRLNERLQAVLDWSQAIVTSAVSLPL